MGAVTGWTRRCLLLCCLVAFAVAPARRALADEAAALARQVSETHGGAVVAVKLVIKVRMIVEGRQVEEDERATEIRATVIDPSGLAVCSLSEIDPSGQSEFMMEEDPEYRFETEVKDVKIILPDGKELAAKVVLRDKDLDLAFLRPAEPPAEPLLAVSLANGATPEVLDEVVVLGRLGDVANRVSSVALDRVHAIVHKPRTFYITGLNTWMSGLGCPTFSLDGRLVGVLVVRSIPSVSSSAGGPLGGTVPVVLPAEDILAIASQVPQQ